MANTREPLIRPIPILLLRPTQMTVGIREVKEKRKRWREQKSKKKQAESLGKHMIPVVYGPDERYYVVDHHHLARALHDEGVKDILVTVIGDLRMVDRDAFWGVMDNKRWVYPYDVKGERRHFMDIPKVITALKDDPFRSLAGDQGPNAPYNGGAKFYQVYSGDTALDHDLRISHIAYDRTHTTATDSNTWFPLPALRRAAAAGRIGAVAPRFHGAPTNRSHRITVETDAPEILARIRQEKSRLLARASQDERKRDTRRKILIGGAVLAATGNQAC